MSKAKQLQLRYHNEPFGRPAVTPQPAPLYIMKHSAAILFLVATLGNHHHDAATAFVAVQPSRCKYTSTAPLFSSPSPDTESKSTTTPFDTIIFQPTEIDASNIPPNLQTILTSLEELKSGSDLRGTYAAHANSGGTIANISHLVKKVKELGNGAALTPFASHCFGVAFARWLLKQDAAITTTTAAAEQHKHGNNALTICIGRDPRKHGERLADAFARGAESVDGITRPVRVMYTGVTTTPSMYEFCR
jgi:hypothetical protein